MEVSNKLSNVYKAISSINLIGALAAVEFALILSGLLLKVPSAIMVVIVLLPIIIFFFLESKSPVYFLISAIMFTEFYWIEILEGYIKPFHIMSVLLFLIFSIYYLKIMRHSKILWLLFIFVLINMSGILFSINKIDSLRSFVLPVILITIAVNIFVCLYKDRLSLKSLEKIILIGSLVAVIFGVVQMVGYSFWGKLLTLTDVQNYQITLAKRPPSFFTEADTFGKFLIFPFFFLLPLALKKHGRFGIYSKISLVLLLIGIIINMTRSAMIGMGITLIVYVIHSLKGKNLNYNVAILSTAIAIILILLPFSVGFTKMLGSYDELMYRFQTIVNPSQLVADGSTHFRKVAFLETLKGSVENISVFFLGHGWGQSYIHIWNIPRDVGGNLFLNILYYSGVFALLIFLWFCYRVLKVFLIAAKNRYDGNLHLFAEGLFFSFLCMLIISQFASMWIAPEFWLVIGCAIYLEIYQKRKLSQRA